MKYLLVPFLTEVTLPLFFCFCLPFVMLLIVIIIWLQLLLNEAEMPSAEEIKKQTFDESNSLIEDEPTEEESQNDTSSTEMQEETEFSGSGGNLSPNSASLSSNRKSQKQSLFALIADSWFQSQMIRYSSTERSDFCGIVLLLCTILSSFTWKFVCQLLQMANVLRIQLLPSSLILYMAQYFVLLGEKAVKILGSLGLESRGLLASVFGGSWSGVMKLRTPPQGRNKAGSPTTINSSPTQHQ